MSKDVSAELFDGSSSKSGIFVVYIEVNVEPVSLLNQKAHSDKVSSFFLSHGNDESSGKLIKNVVRDAVVPELRVSHFVVQYLK